MRVLEELGRGSCDSGSGIDVERFWLWWEWFTILHVVRAICD